VALVSIPRDLYVYLPGYTISRINTAWIYGETLHVPGGGPQLLFDTVRYNLGVRLDRYALVEMAGFQQVVDTLGGVEVRVACDFTDWRLRRPDLPQQAASSWALFTVPRGVTYMDGDQALWYARSRSRSSDFDRTRRQQEVLRALYRASLQPEVLSRLPELFETLQSAVKTDGDLNDLLSLAPFVTRLEPAHLRSRFIGRSQVRTYRVPVSGAAVLLPRPEAIHAAGGGFTRPTRRRSDPRAGRDRPRIGPIGGAGPGASPVRRIRRRTGRRRSFAGSGVSLIGPPGGEDEISHAILQLWASHSGLVASAGHGSIGGLPPAAR
jgi:LCP family protein required for cell wall assembly